MRGRGINYDTGFTPGGNCSRRSFDPDVVRRELRIVSDPRYDLDMASYGVVRVLEEGSGTGYPGLGWEPKEAFHALAEAYAV